MSRIWLFGAVTFIIALVVGGIAVALVTTRGGLELLPSDSPEGVVQRYLLAMKDEEYREAYGYLSSDCSGSAPTAISSKGPLPRRSGRATLPWRTPVTWTTGHRSRYGSQYSSPVARLALLSPPRTGPSI
jgi:hypothetical protein